MKFNVSELKEKNQQMISPSEFMKWTWFFRKFKVVWSSRSVKDGRRGLRHVALLNITTFMKIKGEKENTKISNSKQKLHNG